MENKNQWWKHRTLRELQGTPVKATFRNGGTLTGVMDDDGDVDYGEGRCAVVLTEGTDGCAGDLFSDVSSLERHFSLSENLLITDFDQLHTGDIVELDNGNYHRVSDTHPQVRIFVLGAVGEMPSSGFTCLLDRDRFVRAFRLQLPTSDGLFKDAHGDLWHHCGNTMRQLQTEGEWINAIALELPDDEDLWQLGAFAPFTPFHID